MAAILADDIFKCIFLNEDDKISIKMSLKLVPRSPIDNKPAFVQVMAWCRTYDMQLPEPMLTQFTDAYIRHSGEMSINANPNMKSKLTQKLCNTKIWHVNITQQHELQFNYSCTSQTIVFLFSKIISALQWFQNWPAELVGFADAPFYHAKKRELFFFASCWCTEILCLPGCWWIYCGSY